MRSIANQKQAAQVPVMNETMALRGLLHFALPPYAEPGLAGFAGCSRIHAFRSPTGE
jgi:hypothetical protein